MTKQADLIHYLFEGQARPIGDAQDPIDAAQHRFDAAQHRFDAALSAELLQWMETSSRFTAFVDLYRDKIRKKIRLSRGPENALDLRSELVVAYALLNHRSLAVAYEPYASAKRRGPDFAVTYRANLVFNLEVARIREEAQEKEAIDLPRKEERIVRIVLDKLGQMQPGMANLLAIQSRAALVQSIHLDRLMQAVKTRAEGKDPALYAGSRYTGPADFYKDFLRLSGMLLWASAPDIPVLQLWGNKQARPGLPEKVLRLVSLALQTHSLPSGAAPA